VFAAAQVAQGLSEKDVLVVLLPDTGRNYLSSIFNDDWMKTNGFADVI
jgi:cystathionine beta-synthase